MSASTEIVRTSRLHDGADADNVLAAAAYQQQVNLDHDPRHFHGRQVADSTPGASPPTSGQPISTEATSPNFTAPSSNDSESQNSTATANTTTSDTNTPHSHSTNQPPPPQLTFHPIPQITFITTFTPTPTTTMSSPSESESDTGSWPPTARSASRSPSPKFAALPEPNWRATMVTTLPVPTLFVTRDSTPGDAVDSDADIATIIERLQGEQDPVGGPPPASEEAIERLGVKKVGEGGGDGGLEVGDKCVVCVEEFGKGEEVAVLPCEHCFHGACVKTWLGLHGTCPVCRASVEVGSSKGAGETETLADAIYLGHGAQMQGLEGGGGAPGGGEVASTPQEAPATARDNNADDGSDSWDPRFRREAFAEAYFGSLWDQVQSLALGGSFSS